MLFNSLQFLLFFIVIYGLYVRLGHRGQNRLLLLASYVFYGSWNWKFLSLIFISTVLDYFCGIKIYESRDVRQRKKYLFLSILGNLSILGFFKYFNFFASNLQGLLGFFGFSIQPHYLNIILPIGISFYTFQTMSYTIDIYRKGMEPTRKFLDFALFVSFFPQLVAGPIERAKRLLPQILSERILTYEKFSEGCYLIFLGLFQKIFVADNLAKIVDPVFTGQGSYNGIAVLLALYAFAFQIYCDFAGYTNIARGLGKMMGFEIMLNFNLPYFSTNPREFWKRWHISLSSWFRDYVYIPLGGNRAGAIATFRNITITMLLAGLWHGATWNFVLWGGYQCVLLISYNLLMPWLNQMNNPRGFWMGKIWFLGKVIFFFHLVCLGWLIFRAQSLGQILDMMKALIFNFQFTADFGLFEGLKIVVSFFWFVCFLIVIDLVDFVKNQSLGIFKLHWVYRGLVYFSFFFLITTFSVGGAKEFIYFQF